MDRQNHESKLTHTQDIDRQIFTLGNDEEAQNDETEAPATDLRMEVHNIERQMSTLDLRVEGQDYENEMSTITVEVREHHNESETSAIQAVLTRLLYIANYLQQSVKRNRKLLICTVFVLKELLDCIFDWLLYEELYSLKEGLVFGAVNFRILQSLLAFCVIGTVIGVFDILNRLQDIRTGSPFIDIDITEVSVMYLEDIPQLVISFIIFLCRGVIVSIYAFIKSLIILISSIATLDYSMRKCSKGNQDFFNCKEKTKSFTRLLRYGTAVTFSISLIMSVYGIIKFPFSKDHSERYYFKVGIYFDTKDLHFPSYNSENTTWMKLFDINDVFKYGEITTQITADSRDIRIQTSYAGKQKNDTDICFHRNGMNDVYFNRVAKCTLSNVTTLHYQFIHLPRSKRQPYGDIQYNIQKTSELSCDYIALSHVPRLRYLRLNLSKNVITRNMHGLLLENNAKDGNITYHSTDHLLGVSVENETVYTFYNPKDLIDLWEGWTTGVFPVGILKRCSISGSVTPNFNPDISVYCVKNSTSKLI